MNLRYPGMMSKACLAMQRHLTLDVQLTLDYETQLRVSMKTNVKMASPLLCPNTKGMQKCESKPSKVNYFEIVETYIFHPIFGGQTCRKRQCLNIKVDYLEVFETWCLVFWNTLHSLF